MLILAVLWGLIVLAVAAGLVFYLVTFFIGGPFVLTPASVVSKIMDMAQVGPGDKLVDLGSGDGRIILAAARRGAQATGFELHPYVYLWCRWWIRQQGLEDGPTVLWRDFWNADLSPFDVVTLYLIPHRMSQMETKLQRELRSGTRVVSYAFPFPHWTPLKKDPLNRVFLYRVA